MRTMVLLLAAALMSPVASAASTSREFVELPSGRYAIALTGLVTTVCGRAIAAEWTKLPQIESVSVDFDKSAALVTVRLGPALKVASLRKALRRAEKLAGLGARYDIGDISYLLVK